MKDAHLYQEMNELQQQIYSFIISIRSILLRRFLVRHKDMFHLKRDIESNEYTSILIRDGTN